MYNHLIFYDGECGFCDRAVQFLLKHDHKKLFLFAPLQGETAKQLLDPLPQLDTVVLLENYTTAPQKHILAKASFRSMWLLGGMWAIPGLLHFLPGSLINWGYRLIARHRHQLMSACQVPTAGDRSRFLP